MRWGRVREGRAVDALVVLGIICCVGLMAISAVINYRVGYRRADTEFDGWVYGLGMGLADLVKAIVPFMMAWAWSRRAIWTTIVGAVLFGLVTLASLQAGLEFAAELRSTREGARIASVDQRRALTEEIASLEASIRLLGPQRSPAEIEQEIAAVMARPVTGGTVGRVSQNCTLNRRVTREACAEIARLRAELERARTWEQRTEKLQGLRSRLVALGAQGVGRVDPQLETVSGVLGWFGRGVQKDEVRLGLLLLVGLVLEAASGLGLFVVTTPWRLKAEQHPMNANIIETAERLGSVEEYAKARVQPVAGNQVTCSAVFLDYRNWCVRRGVAPYREGDFIEGFDELARRAEIPVRESGGNIVYMDVALGDDAREQHPEK